MASLISILFICIQCCTQSLCGCSCHENDFNMAPAMNAFGFDLFQKLGAGSPGSDTDNLFISPSSLAITLAMIAEGAEGKTKEEILSTIGLGDWGEEKSADYFQSLISSLRVADSQCSLEIANSIWIDRTIPVKASFTGKCNDKFDAMAVTRDFRSKATLDEINSWCSDKTHGKIPSIVDRLDSELVMALLNALYFKGPWSFDWARTNSGVFHDIDANDTAVSMMNATDYMAFAENGEFEVLELPYGNGSFVLDILLPKDGNKFAEAATTLNGQSWKSLSEDLKHERVYFTIPQFKIETDEELSGVLKNMGISLAFSNLADFSSMSDSPLQISMVKQKTYVDINEKGTEAAAVTLIGVKNMSLHPAENKPRRFVADRPFIFLIRELSTEAILFIGQKTR